MAGHPKKSNNSRRLIGLKYLSRGTCESTYGHLRTTTTAQYITVNRYLTIHSSQHHQKVRSLLGNSNICHTLQPTLTRLPPVVNLTYKTKLLWTIVN